MSSMRITAVVKENGDVIFERRGIAVGIVADVPAVATHGEREGIEALAGGSALGDW